MAKHFGPNMPQSKWTTIGPRAESDDLVHTFHLTPAKRQLYERERRRVLEGGIPFVESVDPGSTYSLKTDIPIPQGEPGKPPPLYETLDWSPSVAARASSSGLAPRFLKTGDSQWERAQHSPLHAGDYDYDAAAQLAIAQRIKQQQQVQQAAKESDSQELAPNGLLAPEEQSGWSKFWSDPDRVGPLSQAMFGVGASLLESAGPKVAPYGRAVRGGIAGYGRGMAMVDARNRRAEQKTIMQRAEEMYPYQLAVNKTAAARARGELQMLAQWPKIVDASSVTVEEKQQLLQMNPREGGAYLRQIAARNQRIPLSEAQRTELPEPLREEAAGLRYNKTTGKIESIYADNLQAERAAYNRAQLTVANKAPSLEQNAVNILRDRNLKLQQNLITPEQLRNDYDYNAALDRIFGEQTRITYTDAAGVQKEGWRKEPLPSHIFDSRTQQAPPVSAQGVPLAQDRPPDRVVSDAPVTTPARRTELRDNLSSVAKVKPLILELRSMLKADEGQPWSLPGTFTKTGPTVARISGLTIAIQDVLKDVSGYGAPQEAELERLKQMLHDPTNIDPVFYLKSGYDEKGFVLEQLKMVEEYIKSQEQIYNDELGLEKAKPWGLDANGGDDEDGDDDTSNWTKADWENALVPYTRR